ncbi:MAG: molybdenum cofactor guanylyltransferase [Candidatus Eremiobacteraeota bacterium]|nr:molybdenum cofactor guanylyltransferase [Candidatus Eremiobacteraeota bacterium]
MLRATSDVAICLLAGGRATRFADKLQSDAGGVPLIVRAFNNVRTVAPVYLCGNTDFRPAVDAQLDCPRIHDRQSARGPLEGLVSAFTEMPHKRIFALAGDAPYVDEATLDEIERAWQDGDEAVVPARANGGRMRYEPLCALYDRVAFLREAEAVLKESRAVVAVVHALRTRQITLRNDRALFNVNTESDARQVQ